MLGSTPISAVLGSGVNNTDHAAVRSFIKAACDTGLSLLLIQPGTKHPFDGRTANRRASDDEIASEKARQQGRPNWRDVKSESGLALATTDSKTILKYLDEYIKRFGPDCAVNLAVEVGGSRIVVVDCDTNEQRRRFLEEATGDPDSPLPPTVISPGTQNEDGTWAHEPGNGHYWFTLPDGLDLPTDAGSMTWGTTNGFAILWHRHYALIPPSTRAEGAYEMVSHDNELPPWLGSAIIDYCAAKQSRRAERGAERDEELASAIDEWADSVGWDDILLPHGWMLASRPDNCGCEVWTAPGVHSSPKSATAHDSGCALGRYTQTNAPLHIWTDNPGAPFDSYIADSHSKTISKLQAVAAADFGGSIAKAMNKLGLSNSLADNIVHADGLDVANLHREIPSVAPSTPAHPVGPFEREDESEGHNPDVWDSGIDGAPVIAPWTHWRDLPAPEYLIEGLIEHGGLSSIIGAPGVGKSAVALDMACCIASGKPWQGRKTLKTKVLYMPGEGLRGVIQRIKAWCYENDVPEDLVADNLLVSATIIQLNAKPEAWAWLMEKMLTERVGLVIFDTFARMHAGIEENSASDVTAAIRRFDRVREQTGAGVQLIHHTGKATPTSGRGSSALFGALESELLVCERMVDEADPSFPLGKPIEVRTTKQKNDEESDPVSILMRSCSAYSAPYITGPGGEIDPMAGVAFASPTDEPAIETAIRIAKWAEKFPEQGFTRTDAAAGVKVDAFTAGRRNATKVWKQKVSEAVDLGLRLGLLETASGERLGARYVRGPVGTDAARSALVAEVTGSDDW